MVSAAGEDLLGGMGQQIIDTVMNIANYEVTFPASSVYGMDPVSAKAPLWNYVFVFMIIFSILWLASAQVPLFKDQENQGPRKAFAIAFSFLTMLGTPAVSWVKKLISTFTNLAMIAILVLGVYTIWVIFKGGWAANRKTGATATSSMAEATREVAEAKRVNAQTAEYKKKTEHAIRHGMTQQVTAIKSLRGDLTTLLGKFNGYPGRAGAVSTDNSINKLLGKISSDAGKILTYMTENDRMMTGMTKRLYDESGTTGLGSSRATTAADIYGPVGRRVTEVMKNGDTQTNDLGRIISGMAERVRAGIPANVNELRDMTAQAINITQRMERDIVLESQMIEKI
jgi:hypothetical protein